ncbi:MAG TPA: arsenate reductase ArsC, partial [Gaiellaceae bacterium]|nr:arsenate reductase ArsC [Gaiellaceae bacterium]
YSSYDEFAEGATITTYLPLIAQRFARQRLLALSRVEGHDTSGKPIVLFLCVHNAARSQMALGFFTHYAADNAIAWSGGSRPVRAIQPVAIEAMAERGIDISGEYAKPWTDEVVRAADVVITMGCGDACPIYPGKRYEDWVLDDPEGADLEQVRDVRDEIERRVLVLMDDLGLSVG